MYLLDDSSYSSEIGVKDSCLSSKVLTADELAILLKGLNFTPTPLPHVLYPVQYSGAVALGLHTMLPFKEIFMRTLSISILASIILSSVLGE